MKMNNVKYFYCSFNIMPSTILEHVFRIITLPLNFLKPPSRLMFKKSVSVLPLFITKWREIWFPIFYCQIDLLFFLFLYTSCSLRKIVTNLLWNFHIITTHITLEIVAVVVIVIEVVLYCICCRTFLIRNWKHLDTKEIKLRL